MAYRQVAAAIASVLAISACAAVQPPDESGSSPSQVASVPSAATSVEPRYQEARCPNPEGGTANRCLGELDAGTYTARALCRA